MGLLLFCGILKILVVVNCGYCVLVYLFWFAFVFGGVVLQVGYVVSWRRLVGLLV